MIEGEFKDKLPDDFRVPFDTYNVQRQKPILDKNAYQFNEFQLNLSNMTLQGSPSSYEATDALYSGFFLVTDDEAVNKDSINNCLNDSDCVETLKD